MPSGTTGALLQISCSRRGLLPQAGGATYLTSDHRHASGGLPLSAPAPLRRLYLGTTGGVYLAWRIVCRGHLDALADCRRATTREGLPASLQEATGSKELTKLRR